MEIWKPLKGYEGLFRVSSQGNVESVDKYDRNGRLWRGKALSKGIVGTGYERVSLCVDNKTRYVYVHRLVAETFIPNPENKPQVNHKDGNKRNNCVENLEWVTPSENIRHSFHELGQKSPRAQLGKPSIRRKLTDQQADAIRKDNRICRVIASEYGVCEETIRNIKIGKTYVCRAE